MLMTHILPKSVTGGTFISNQTPAPNQPSTQEEYGSYYKLPE